MNEGEDAPDGYMTSEEIRAQEALSLESISYRKTVEIVPGTRSLAGWYYADVFLGPIPLIKLVLVLLTLILIGVWR